MSTLLFTYLLPALLFLTCTMGTWDPSHDSPWNVHFRPIPTCPTRPMPQDSARAPLPHKTRSLCLHFPPLAIFLPHFRRLLLPVSHLLPSDQCFPIYSQDSPLVASTHQARITQNRWPTHRLAPLTALASRTLFGIPSPCWKYLGSLVVHVYKPTLRT